MFDNDIDSNQEMSAEFEEMGFSTEAASVGDSVSNASSSATCRKDEAVASDPKSGKTAKRSAAEISEDEDSSLASSQERKMTRSIISSSPTASSITACKSSPLLAPKAAATRAIAPKLNGNSKSFQAKKAASAAELGRQIDTSTAHVKALTGAKGAAMCFEIVAGTTQDTTIPIPNLVSTDLSPEEKSKLSRDRNRLHARNTRIRKKAYLDELKRTLDVLVEERDSVTSVKTRQAQVNSEEREVRFSVMQEYLRLRGSNEQAATGRWNAILEEEVSMCLPSLDCNDNAKDTGGSDLTVTILGVKELMNESNTFAQRWLQSEMAIEKSSSNSGTTTALSMVFHCDRKSFLMEGTSCVMDWTAESTDPSKKNFFLHGTFRADFNPHSNRLRSIDLVFDSSPLLASGGK